MGDNLAELLYRAFCNGAGLSYGSDETPGWHNLRSEMRYAWEQVAAKARTTMLDRVFATLEDIPRELPPGATPEDTASELRARLGR